MSDLAIVDVEAIPCSVAMNDAVPMGVGTVVKREAVVVKVTTASGIVGYGEAHHARAPGAVAAIINTTMRDLVIGMDASESSFVWKVLYENQLATHGTGAAGACAISGIDIALWDIRGKAAGLPVYQLLGGRRHAIPAYAGGISLGYQPPEALVAEVAGYRERGFTAVKLRIGQTVANDISRVSAVRAEFGDELTILTDANAQYSLADASLAGPALRELAVGWLEEPFSPHARRQYERLKSIDSPALAAGENHYTRFEFQRLLEDDVVDIWQPDVSKCGGVTEIMRIAAMASALKIPMCPHTSITGINMAVTVHVIASIPDAVWFEAEVGKENRLRDEVASGSYDLTPDGCVMPFEGPGLGIEVDEDFVRSHPLTPGPAFVRN